MCYDVTSGTRQLIKYATHRGDDPEYIASLQIELEKWIKQIQPHYYVSGFSHPKLLVFTNEHPLKPQALNWGMIPFWVTSSKVASEISNKTLNARAETIFEKPSFRSSAKNKRCLIYLDAFYEHHHHKGKAYPFHVSMKSGEPLAIAGLWDEWVDKNTGEIFQTVSIITTKANPTMTKIHNNPKLKEARMPAIIPKDQQNEWLKPIQGESDKNNLLELLVPYDDSQLDYRSVRKLKGKDAIGDCPEAEEEYIYEELLGF